jgi:Ca-activated chloride channel family protein
VRIYTIGIGGGPVGVRTPFGTLMQRPGDLDPQTLRAVAEETGGRFFEATDTDQLEAVYAELDRLEPSVRDSLTYRPMRALYAWPAAASLLLTAWIAMSGASIGAALSASRRRSPKNGDTRARHAS